MQDFSHPYLLFHFFHMYWLAASKSYHRYHADYPVTHLCWTFHTCASDITFKIFQLLIHESIHSCPYEYWLAVTQTDLRHYLRVIQQSIHVVLFIRSFMVVLFYKVFIHALFRSSDIDSQVLAGS